MTMCLQIKEKLNLDVLMFYNGYAKSEMIKEKDEVITLSV